MPGCEHGSNMTSVLLIQAELLGSYVNALLYNTSMLASASQSLSHGSKMVREYQEKLNLDAVLKI